MTIVAFEMSSLEAQRFSKDIPKNLRIDYNIKIERIFKAEKDVAQVDYAIIISYGPIGIIKIGGNLLYRGEAEVLYRNWKSGKSMPPKAFEEIYNRIMRECTLEALILARKVALPPPVKVDIPYIKAEKAQKKVSYGPEVA